jgi:hypothetical protein
MAAANQMVTVFRSADMNAEEQATAARELLVNANIPAELFDDSAPGVPHGAYEVRVPVVHEEDARRLIETQRDFTEQPVDLSHDLDMVPVYSSGTGNAEVQALEIRSILDAQGIPSVLVSGSMFPSLEFQVRVPKTRLDEARQAIAAAEAAGPEAAEAAELESEGAPGEGPGSRE